MSLNVNPVAPGLAYLTEFTKSLVGLVCALPGVHCVLTSEYDVCRLGLGVLDLTSNDNLTAHVINILLSHIFRNSCTSI